MNYIIVMPWIWVQDFKGVTCNNVSDLQNVVMMTFIAQLVGVGCIFVSTFMICLMWCQPLKCCKRTKITPEEFSDAFNQFVEIQRENEEIQRNNIV